MEPLPTINEDPPTPRPIRVAERWRVIWHGRRDARRLPVGADLPPPYLETLRAEAEAGQRTVSGWLHRKIVPVDREAVELLTLLEQHRRDPVPRPAATVPRPAPDDGDPRSTFAIPAWVREARQAAAAQQEFDRHIKERNLAERRLGQLGSIRHHLIEAARAAAGAHIARYEQLVGLYCATLLRRQPNRDLAAVGYRPRAVTAESWVHGDMPLLTLEFTSELAERYRWFLKEFATRTSTTPRPIPVEVPRAG
ncbi:MAG TPA: hypothetical protein VFQ77_15360 [Pseudonocardiaceae bacterium]|jgi:hypothetical protein|nr:hypothetical protein [Pseudonocardiaceae bacterium]